MYEYGIFFLLYMTTRLCICITVSTDDTAIAPIGTALDDDSPDACCICLEDMKKGDIVRILPCEHMFHCGCIEEWIQRSPECPICRQCLLESHSVSA